MGKSATVGACLASLAKMAVPLCQRAERECPRTGPGRKPDIPDWVLAVLIMVAVLKKKVQVGPVPKAMHLGSPWSIQPRTQAYRRAS